jgi:hypothetical protein
VVIIDPYNQEIREGEIARGGFALDAVDGGCVRLLAKIAVEKNSMLTAMDGGRTVLWSRKKTSISGWGSSPAVRTPRDDRVPRG